MLANATVWVPMLAPTSITVSPGLTWGADRLDLEIAPLAVEVEAAPDEGVVAAVHEQAVAAVLDRDVTVLDQIGRLHRS
jgi:hypothetical protein